MITRMPQRYVSNKNESVRMFESDFMEFFSHVHPATPLIIYVPLMSYMLYLAATARALPLGLIAALFATGVLIWSFVEYTMHRWVFHYEPKTKWGRFLHFMLHGVHHDYPNDASRLVMPPAVSIPLAFMFYGLFLLLSTCRLSLLPRQRFFGTLRAIYICGQLDKVIKTRRHHICEPGLPLCLSTFRAFLQLSNLLKPDSKESGFFLLKCHSQM